MTAAAAETPRRSLLRRLFARRPAPRPFVPVDTAICGVCAAPGMMTKVGDVYVHDSTGEAACRPDDIRAARCGF